MLLKKWGEVYTPDHQVPGATLMRKYFHTKLMDSDFRDKALQLISEMDGHSKSVAGTHYVTSNPSADAKVMHRAIHVSRPLNVQKTQRSHVLKLVWRAIVVDIYPVSTARPTVTVSSRSSSMRLKKHVTNSAAKPQLVL